MSLKKGFLREPAFVFDRWILFSGLVLSTAMAFALYAISIFCAEVFRSAFTNLVDQLLLLTKADIQFYGYTLAFMATVFGQGFGLQLMIGASGRHKVFKARFARRNMQNQVSFNLWVWLYWFAKWFSLMGVIYASFDLHYEFDLRSDYGYLFVLLPLVLFLSYWLGSHRVFRKNTYKYMAIGLLHLGICTLIIGNIRVVDHEAFNQMMENRFPELKYEMALPEAVSQKTFSRYRKNIITYLVIQEGETRAFFPLRDHEPLSLKGSSVAMTIQAEQDSYNRAYYYDLKVLLTPDARVPLKDLLAFEEIVRARGLKFVYYNATVTNSRYPWHHPVIRNAGMPKYLPQDCSKEKATVDSLRQLGYIAKKIRWPDFGCYRLTQVLRENRVHIKHDETGFYLNNREIQPDALSQMLYELIQQYPKINLLYQPSPDLTVGAYIQGRDLLMQAVIKNRIKAAGEQCDLEYDYSTKYYFEDAEHAQNTEWQYPINITELTGWNLEFYEYLKE